MITRTFLRGLAVLLPIALTIYLVTWLFIWIDQVVREVLAFFGFGSSLHCHRRRVKERSKQR